jgi:curved DNA-binding protein CbpA
VINYYEVLGVPPASATEQIKERYRALARAQHPDVGGNAEQFAKITEAGGVLSDAKRRADYDAKLRLLMDPCPDCQGKGCNYRQLTFTDRAAVRCATCNGGGWRERR